MQPTPSEVQWQCDRVIHVLDLASVPPAPRPGGGRSSGPRAPMPDVIVEAKHDLKVILTSWALMIAEESGDDITVVDDTLTVLAWIRARVIWLAGHPAAEDFMAEVGNCCRPIENAYSHEDRRVFCGMHSGMPVWADRRQTTVILPDGRVERVESLQEGMKGQLMDALLPAGDAAAVCRTFFDLDVTGAKIHKALEYDRKARRACPLEVAAMDGKVRLYRIADVVGRFAMKSLSNA